MTRRRLTAGSTWPLLDHYVTEGMSQSLADLRRGLLSHGALPLLGEQPLLTGPSALAA